MLLFPQFLIQSEGKFDINQGTQKESITFNLRPQLPQMFTLSHHLHLHSQMKDVFGGCGRPYLPSTLPCQDAIDSLGKGLLMRCEISVLS